MLRRSDIYFYNICVFEYNNDSMLQAGSQSRWCFLRSNCIKSAQSDCHINQLLLQISYSKIFFCNKLLIVYRMDFLIRGVIMREAIIFVWNNVTKHCCYLEWYSKLHLQRLFLFLSVVLGYPKDVSVSFSLISPRMESGYQWRESLTLPAASMATQQMIHKI